MSKPALVVNLSLCYWAVFTNSLEINYLLHIYFEQRNMFCTDSSNLQNGAPLSRRFTWILIQTWVPCAPLLFPCVDTDSFFLSLSTPSGLCNDQLFFSELVILGHTQRASLFMLVAKMTLALSGNPITEQLNGVYG